MRAWLTLNNMQLPHMCYYYELGRPKSNSMHGSMSVRMGPKRFWERWRPLQWVGARLTPWNTPFSCICYHAAFGRSKSNGRSGTKICRKKIGLSLAANALCTASRGKNLNSVTEWKIIWCVLDAFHEWYYVNKELFSKSWFSCYC